MNNQSTQTSEKQSTWVELRRQVLEILTFAVTWLFYYT